MAIAFKLSTEDMKTVLLSSQCEDFCLKLSAVQKSALISEVLTDWLFSRNGLIDELLTINGLTAALASVNLSFLPGTRVIIYSILRHVEMLLKHFFYSVAQHIGADRPR